MATLNLDKYISVVEYSKRRLGLTTAVGVLVGVLTWLLSLFVQWAFVEPVFCRSVDSFNACANGGTISIVIALAIVNSLGLFALIRLGVFRPLLVVIAALVTLAGTNSWLGSLSWYEASLWYGLLFGITYALYAWVARIKTFWAALALMAIILFGLRLFMARS